MRVKQVTVLFYSYAKNKGTSGDDIISIFPLEQEKQN